MASGRGIKLTEQHLRLIYDTFKLLDDDKDGMIDKGQFFTLFRALGQTTSDALLSKAFAEAVAEQEKSQKSEGAAKQATPTPVSGATEKTAPPPQGGCIAFQQFSKTFGAAYQKPISESTLISAFGVFDSKNSGKLSVAEFQEILTKRGEPLPKAEVDELLLVAAIGSAKQVDYALLAKRLIKGPAGIATINAL